MWDDFSELGRALDEAEATIPSPPSADQSAEQYKELEATLEAAAQWVPWYRLTFLDDADLFASLDLDTPGMEAVKAAVAGKEWSVAKEELRACLRRREKPHWGFDWHALPQRNPDYKNERADEIVAHIHRYAAYEPYQMPPDIDWHIRPVDDIEWPTHLHRHYHLNTLADAYAASGNETYANEYVQQILDWIKDNPLEPWDSRTYRWGWSTLNIAQRIDGAWSQGYLKIVNSPRLTPDANATQMKVLREQARFLIGHRAGGGNWLLAESRALIMAGCLFPEFREAAAWREEGLARLKQEAQTQIYDDGMHVELTPGYHGFSLSSFEDAVELAIRNDLPWPPLAKGGDGGVEEYLERLEKMYEYYLYALRPDGRSCAIGDAGSGSLRGWLEKGAQVFGRDDMLYAATGGQAGTPPVHTSYAFPVGGFYVMRSDWQDEQALFMYIDAAKWAGGHSHLDCFTFFLYAYGDLLIDDAGIYTYNRNLSGYFYGTPGHNTILLDGKDQARQPDPMVHRWITNPHFDYLDAEHHYYEGVTHRRRWLFVKPLEKGGVGYWVIRDTLTGEGTYQAQVRFHLPPDVAVEIDANTGTACTVREGKPNLLLLTRTNGARLEQEPGWISYSYGTKQETPVVQLVQEGPLPLTFTTVLISEKPGETVTASLRDIPGFDYDPLQIAPEQVTIGERTDRLILSDDGQLSLQINGVEVPTASAPDPGLPPRRGGSRYEGYRRYYKGVQNP
jgi:heparan-sulfate lyase